LIHISAEAALIVNVFTVAPASAVKKMVEFAPNVIVLIALLEARFKDKPWMPVRFILFEASMSAEGVTYIRPGPPEYVLTPPATEINPELARPVVLSTKVPPDPPP
jgi:hypothetical protein